MVGLKKEKEVSKADLLTAFYDIITPEKREKFDELAALRSNYVTVAVENLNQEHNASAVMRSCDCFGIRDLHIVEKNHQFTVQRDIAKGSKRWVKHHHYSDVKFPTSKCINSLKTQGYKVVAMTPHEQEVSIWDLPLDEPLAFFFGTEISGLSEQALSLADTHCVIPMYGFTESFNISVSAALTLQIIRSRLEERNDIDWLLNEDEQIDLKLHWCKQIVRNSDIVEREFIQRLQQH